MKFCKPSLFMLVYRTVVVFLFPVMKSGWRNIILNTKCFYAQVAFLIFIKGAEHFFFASKSANLYCWECFHNICSIILKNKIIYPYPCKLDAFGRRDTIKLRKTYLF